MSIALKIITLNLTDIFGGAAKASYRLNTELKRRQVNIKTIVLNKSSQQSDVVVATDLYSLTDKLMDQLERSFFFMLRMLRLKKIKEGVYYLYKSIVKSVLQREEFQLLHLNWVNEGMINFIELSRLKKPIVWTLHDSNAFTGFCHIPNACEGYKNSCGNCPQLNSKGLKDLSYRMLSKKQKRYQQLDLHIVCPSNWLAACASASTLFKDKKIHVIPNGIDTKLFDAKDKLQARRDLGLKENIKYILFGSVSVKDPNKGYHFLKEALNIFFKQNAAAEYEIIVFGTHFNKADLGEVSVRDLGYINDEAALNKIYAACDVTVVPSISENLSNTIVESMASGTPVVAFNIGGNSDIISHQLNGYLAKPYEVNDLADGLSWCMANNKDSGLSKKAREKILDHFDITLTAKKYLDLYHSLLND